MPRSFKIAQYGYYCPIRPMNKKAWIDVGSPCFSYLQPIQDIVVMRSAAKPLISPTYLNIGRTWDICNYQLSVAWFFCDNI